MNRRNLIFSSIAMLFSTQAKAIEETATRAQSREINGSKSPKVWLFGKTKDGIRLIVEREDRGDLIPGYDKSGNRFEAYTTYFKARRPMEDGQFVKEWYTQVPREMWADRLRCEAADLEDQMNADVLTLESRRFFNDPLKREPPFYADI